MTRVLLSLQSILFAFGLLCGMLLVVGYTYWLGNSNRAINPNFDDSSSKNSAAAAAIVGDSVLPWQLDTAGGSLGYSGRRLSLVSSSRLKQMENEDVHKKNRNDRILCWILTGPAKHARKADVVKVTWGRRCDKLLFISSDDDKRLGTIAIPEVGEGRSWLWAKTRRALEYIWQHHRDDADWFLKADSDAYVIVENLRTLLSSYNSTQALHFGYQFKTADGRTVEGFMDSGPGYIMSRRTLERFAVEATQNDSICEPAVQNPRPFRGVEEDVELARCLKNIGGVTMVDPTDNVGWSRFLRLSPELHAERNELPESEGDECCKDTALSFHNLKSQQVRMLEYLLYHVRIPYKKI